MSTTTKKKGISSMVINRKELESEWYNFPESEAKFKIRPFPRFTMLDSIKESERMWLSFGYALQDWKNLKEENGTEFIYSEDNKKVLFDFVIDIVNFVFEKANDKYLKITEQLKN